MNEPVNQESAQIPQEAGLAPIKECFMETKCDMDNGFIFLTWWDSIPKDNPQAKIMFGLQMTFEHFARFSWDMSKKYQSIRLAQAKIYKEKMGNEKGSSLEDGKKEVEPAQGSSEQPSDSKQESGDQPSQVISEA